MTKKTETQKPSSAKPAQSLPVAPRNQAEQTRIEAVADKNAARADGPPMNLKMVDGTVQVNFKHADPALAKILMLAELGTCDPAFLAGMQSQVAAIGAHGRTIDEGASNFLYSVVRGVQPRDELEAMLSVQMGAIHQATMMMARRLNHVSNLPQQDSAERALNKLARTYATQMEALKSYRTGGQQKVTVEHVTVNQGGQAIVGAVTHGGRGGNGK
jgi:hypothetical protein